MTSAKTEGWWELALLWGRTGGTRCWYECRRIGLSRQYDSNFCCILALPVSGGVLHRRQCGGWEIRAVGKGFRLTSVDPILRVWSKRRWRAGPMWKWGVSWIASPFGCIPCNCCKVSGGKINLRWHQQKVYADTYGVMLCLAVEQQTGNIGLAVRYWKPHKLVAATAREPMKMIKIPPTGQKYLSVGSRWFAKYISPEFWKIHDCRHDKIWERFHRLFIGTSMIEVSYE